MSALQQQAKKQSGVALVMAIAIVSLAAITATAITVINQRQVIRTSNLILRDQAFQFAASAENFAIRILNEDGKNNETDHLQEEWYNEGNEQILPIDFANIQDSDKFYLRGTITDLQSRISINDISRFPTKSGNANNTANTSVSQSNTLTNLIGKLNIQTDSVSVLQSSLTDWIDSDNNPTGSSGAEQYYYLGLEQAYQAANIDVQHTSTLAQIRGFDNLEWEDLQLLRQELNALPAGTPLNVNTASDNILASIGLSASAISSVTDNKPYDDVGDFITDINTANEKFNNTDFTVESTYFLLDLTAVMDKARIRINSVIERDNTKNTSKVILRIIGDY